MGLMPLSWWSRRQPPGSAFQPRPVRDAPQQPFIKTASVKLNASGYGYCTITCPSGVTWEIGHQAVSTNIDRSLNVPQPVVKVYQSTAPAAGQYLESTYNGDQATSDSTIVLLPGDSVTAEWFSDANAAASHALLTATYTVRGVQRQVMA